MLVLPQKTDADSVALHARCSYLGSIYWQLFSVSLRECGCIAYQMTLSETLLILL